MAWMVFGRVRLPAHALGFGLVAFVIDSGCWISRPEPIKRKGSRMSADIEAYIVATRDWPLKWGAVVRTPYDHHQTSCFTFRGARWWIKRTQKRIEQGLA